MDWWVRLDQWLRGSAHPLGGAVCMCHVQFPAFAPSTSEVAVELGPFVYLVHNLPQLGIHVVNFSFIVFCCSRRHLSRCKCCSKWPQVVDCLINIV